MAGGPEGRAAFRPLRIVLVEDNPDDADITRRAVARVLPCEVHVIGDGGAAVRALAPADGRPAFRPDLILLDLGLPVRSGVDVLRTLRATPALERTPIVILTTVADDDESILECYTLGANSFLAKPATDGRFAETLQLLVGGEAVEVPARRTDPPGTAPGDRAFVGR